MNTEKQVKTTARDFLISGLQDGHINEMELARWILEGLTNDTDAVKRFIGYFSEEQADYLLDLYEEGDRELLHKQLIKVDQASDITHIIKDQYC